MDDNTLSLYRVVALGLISIALVGVIGLIFLEYKIDLPTEIVGYFAQIPLGCITLLAGFIGGHAVASKVRTE